MIGEAWMAIGQDTISGAEQKVEHFGRESMTSSMSIGP
jgi:hypothetical protein